MDYNIRKFKDYNFRKIALYAAATFLVLGLWLQNQVAFAFDGQVQGAGDSLSVIPGVATYSIKWATNNRIVNLASQPAASLKMQYRVRDQYLGSKFLELQYQRYYWTGLPAPKKLSTVSQNSLGMFIGQKTSSLNRIWLGYSLGATEEFFVTSSTARDVSVEKRIVYHGRLTAALILWSTRYGNNPTAAKNIAPADSPKLRFDLSGGVLSPYRESLMSKYWGWEALGQLTYGNSIQWISLQYEMASQINSNSHSRREGLRVEFSLSLDRKKRLEKGTSW